HALIISHDHADHIRYAGVYQRRYNIPLFITPKTLYRAERDGMLGRLRDTNYFLAGGKIRFGDLSVHTIPTPHDAEDAVAFVVSCLGKRLGILTDLGHSFNELGAVISSLDAVFIESNYDPEMLRRGPYPLSLKRRIRGPKGHLSNSEAAELLLSSPKLQWACLAHLSEKNNHPSVALRTHREIVGAKLALYCASRHKSSKLFFL
ncbi:MAG TPA: MBL fold metallo-hydrolase, partial [Thermodesulfovibrionales bacterium]|nr:MBL fold metallo-hydrolase [Thermodesulfovibrionales bacterium]